MSPPSPTALSITALDAILSAQLAVAWAGEAGEEPRLGWWRTDLCSEFGGEDLLQRVLPNTWRWAVLEAAREAARRVDAASRSQEADADSILTLYHLGPHADARLDERLADLKRAGRPPREALPRFAALVPASNAWDKAAFADALAAISAEARAELRHSPALAGRRVEAPLPARPDAALPLLLGALLPLPAAWPAPHLRGAGW